MEILPEPTLNKLCGRKIVTYLFTLTVLSALRRSGKSKKTFLKPKLVSSTHSNLELIHMDLCGPMRVESINGKKYILENETKGGHQDFIGYESLRGLRIYNHRPRKIIKTIHVKFDESTTMASERSYLEPKSNRFNVEDSLVESNKTSSKEDLDDLFGPLYEEHYEARKPKVSTNFVAPTTLNNEDTPSSSTIIVDYNKAPPLVSTSEESTSSILDDIAYESNQEDSAELDRNTFITPFCFQVIGEAETSSTNHDPLNMHEFNQLYPSTHTWTKAHPLEQVIGDPSKPVMTRSRLNTDAEVCLYPLTMSTTEPKNIKEA
nr:hypothetical protein [Tanacetum cinerariifolium]